jgi:hypothetical protein
MTRDNFYAQVNAVWVILNDWRNDHPEGIKHNDEAWEQATQAIDWIFEDLEAAYNAAQRTTE